MSGYLLKPIGTKGNKVMAHFTGEPVMFVSIHDKFVGKVFFGEEKFVTFVKAEYAIEDGALDILRWYWTAKEKQFTDTEGNIYQRVDIFVD